MAFRVRWGAFSRRIALLALLVLLAARCGGKPGPVIGAGESLRRAFPAHAARVLHGSVPFVASRAGFAAAIAGDPAHAPARRGGLEAALPRLAEDPIRFHLLGGAEIAVREIGAAGEGAIEEEAVAYRRKGGASFWSVTESGYEEWLHLGPGAATGREPAAVWEVDAALRDAGGMVEIAGGDGVPGIRVTAPMAFADDGRPVPARLAVRGRRIELWVDAGGEAVLVDPVWTTVASMSNSREWHASVLLNDGTVLVTGGYGSSGFTTAAERYNPSTGAWSPAGTMITGRYLHTATLLASGKVLVAGGYGGAGSLNSAEVYDPTTNAWSGAAALSTARYMHTAALLASGKVLVAGGYGGAGYLNGAEVYDPTANTWSSAASMINARYSHTAVTLGYNGKVLVAGGYNGAYLTAAELYDPTANTWSAAHAMSAGRAYHAAAQLASDKVLVVGGYGGSYLAAAEVYDPAANTWSSGGAMAAAREWHTATLLASGQVLVAGGNNAAYLATTELYDPTANAWSGAGLMIASRTYHTATLLGSGKVLIVGGYNGAYLSAAELFDPAANAWAPAAALSENREYHTATTLADGTVWVAGGYNTVLSYLSSGARYNPTSDGWSFTASLATARERHSATLLASGQVLVAGGWNGAALSSAEVYDPSSNAFVSSVGSMHDAREYHTATLLPGGQVLVTGGYPGSGALTKVELYDPSTKVWTQKAPMSSARFGHTAVLLSTGNVLVAGGYNGSAAVSSAELYTVSSNTWSAAGTMSGPREYHTAALLPTGQVLAAGGWNGTAYLVTADVYNPSTNTWSPTGALTTARDRALASTLANGWVLVTGGEGSAGVLSSAEIYNPVAGAWLAAAPMTSPRVYDAQSLLSSGKVLVTGGYNGTAVINADEIYTPVVPDDGNPCTVDAWSPTLGQVTHTAVANGTACNDGNACTQTDTCQNGVCTGSSPVVCSALDQCHTAGTCNTGTGVCSNPNKADGTSCNDGNACTQTDTCQAGTCTGSNPVVCTAEDQCHTAGTCNTGTGVCSNPNKADGTSCNDGNACTQTDTCQAGTCTGSNPVVCTAEDQCHAAGTCNTGTGVCSNPNKANGTACNDGNACTQTDTCQSGTCTGGNPVVCTAQDQCHTAGTCNTGTGVCSNPVAANGTACNDGDGCTQGDTCQGGACAAGAPVTCTAANATASCTHGACAIVSCNAGYADCNGNYGDGCEAALDSDQANCGSCGKACAAAAPPCVLAGACGIDPTTALPTCEQPVPLRIDDGNPCTADTCDPTLGILHTPLADGTPCFDGTQTLTCQGGACTGGAAAGPPQLYADGQHESPLRGEPGDLLLLAGTGFDPAATVVVYQSVGNTMLPLSAPSSMPTGQTVSAGVIDTNIWRSAGSLKVVLPEAMASGQSYALWAAMPDPANSGAFLYSNGVLINDARPMWVSPGPHVTEPATSKPYVYTAACRPGIGRTVKVVGRNLQAAPGFETQVRFTAEGADAGVTLIAADDGNPATQIERYAAVVTLPETMPLVNGQATDYDVAVSRDNGGSWVPVPTPITVLPDPPAVTTANSFHPTSYGDDTVTCDPCVVTDHTLCIARAVHAASEYVAPPAAAACSTDLDCPAGQICKAAGKCGNLVANVVFDLGTCGNGIWRLAPVWPTDGTGAVQDIQDGYFTTMHPGQPLDSVAYAACHLFYGIPVLEGVNLIAPPPAPCGPPLVSASAPPSQSSLSTIETEQAFEQPDQGGQFLFTLVGNNVVQGLHFTDSFKSSTSTRGPGSMTLNLDGHDEIITGNFFDGTLAAVQGSAETLAPDGLKANVDVVITGNQIAIWQSGVGTETLEDSVVSDNIFWPGAGFAYPIAIGIGGSERMDVSDNILDGTHTFVDTNDPASTSLYGWRAGMFFPLESPHEDLLVAGNQIACTGTRPGYDGEALSVDSNGGPAYFRWSEEVQSSMSQPAMPGPPSTPSLSQVTVAWPDASIWTTTTQAARFVGSWMRVDYGPGLGQARKITQQATTPTTLTLTVSPAFDVLPIPGSRVVVGNQAWQMNIVDNVVDDTCPMIPVDLTGVHYGNAGVISLYGTATDVTMDANTVINAAGFDVYAQYWDEASTDAGGVHEGTYQTPIYFVDFRSNNVTGQFGGLSNPYNSFGSGLAAFAFTGVLVDGLPQGSDPNVPGFGITVAHNTFQDALISYGTDGVNQLAGIWFVPIDDPVESSAPGFVDTLIFQNAVARTIPSGALACVSQPEPPQTPGPYEAGIEIGASYGATGAANYPQGTVLCGNSTTNVGCLYTDWPGSGQTSSVNSCQ